MSVRVLAVLILTARAPAQVLYVLLFFITFRRQQCPLKFSSLFSRSDNNKCWRAEDTYYCLTKKLMTVYKCNN